MSRREVTQFYDDLDHTLIPEDQLEVIHFSVNGQNYLIDLSTDNARRFHNLLAPYVDAARVAPDINAQRANPSQIRAWARTCLLYTSPSPRDATLSRMPSSA